jgi:hypothetical protein
MWDVNKGQDFSILGVFGKGERRAFRVWIGWIFEIVL